MKKETPSHRPSGPGPDPATGALSPPIHLSTTFERDPDGSYPRGYDYTRTANPNREALEESLRTLEGGAAAAAFASGSAAMMTLLQALSPGDHLIAPDDLYFGIRLLIQEIFVPWGLRATFVDMTELPAVEAALTPQTRLLLVETPSNPLLKITDLQAVTRLAHDAGALLACDNTIASPVLQLPFRWGVDLVVHATTKYLSGHSDVLGGMIVARQESALFDKIRLLQNSGGAVPSPFDCWLALRGLQTLPARVGQQSASALAVARFLAGHPGVESVLYPGLPDHPGHQVAARQMSGYGGLMSFLVRGDQQDAMAVAAGVKVFTRATSFGGTHSLIEHRASIEAPDSTTPVNLLRLSIGLEDPATLIADLDQALG